MLKFVDVDFGYGALSHFHEVNFHLKRGQFLLISGSSRSGKTTLVQLIAGLILPDRGEIIIDGEATTDAVRSMGRLNRLRRKIGGVGGIYKLLEDRTILENIALAAEISGLTPREAYKTARETCHRYHLSHLSGAYPDRVSEVEKRVALLARVEAAKANLIVADGPTDGIDPKAARFIDEKLGELRLAGVSILYLTAAKQIDSLLDSEIDRHLTITETGQIV